MRRNRWVPLILIGWAALAASVLIPLLPSISYWMQQRSGRCHDGLEYTFAPLLVSCGPRSSTLLVIGWTLCGLTVGGIVLAAILASVSVIRLSLGRSDPRARVDARMLFVTVAIVVLIVAALLSAGRGFGGADVWMFYASGASFFVLLLAAVIRPFLEILPSRREP